MRWIALRGDHHVSGIGEAITSMPVAKSTTVTRKSIHICNRLFLSCVSGYDINPRAASDVDLPARASGQGPTLFGQTDKGLRTRTINSMIVPKCRWCCRLYQTWNEGPTLARRTLTPDLLDLLDLGGTLGTQYLELRVLLIQRLPVTIHDRFEASSLYFLLIASKTDGVWCRRLNRSPWGHVAPKLSLFLSMTII